jgi:hypothetical protein
MAVWISVCNQYFHCHFGVVPDLFQEKENVLKCFEKALPVHISHGNRGI